MKIMMVVAALVAASMSTPAHANSWPQDGYDPGHSGYNPAESVINASSVATLKPRWTVKPVVGVPGCQPPPVAPIVLGDRMFLLDGGGISGYDVKSGKRLWTYRAGYFEGSGISVVNGLILGTELNCFSQSDATTNVVAVNPKTGKELWHVAQGWSTDTYAGDAGVFVVSGFCGVCGDAQSGVTAFRVSDGKRLWGRENAVLAGPVAAAGKVLLRSTVKDETEAVNIKTGDPVWGAPDISSVHAASGGRFFVWSATGLRAVPTGGGEELWRIKGEAGDLATDGRRVFVASANRINAYRADTGKLAWTRAVPAPSDPIRAGGLLYARSKKSLVILSAATGKPVASGGKYGTLTEHVVVTGGRLFTTNGALVRSYTP